MQSLDNLLWIDLEMTGLDVNKNRIIEIACIVTDKELNILATGPDLPIKTSRFRLSRMDDWNKTHHRDSGLIKMIQVNGVDMQEAENLILDFIKEFCVAGKTIIAGSSIHHDRKFIDKYMPKFSSYLHHRMLDVTSVRELQKRWYVELPNLDKKEAHRALDDIKESIEWLRYLRSNIFK